MDCAPNVLGPIDMPSTSPLAKDHRLDRDGLADIHFLTQKWQVARAAMGGELPPYENIMLGNLGDLSDHIILIDCANDVCSIVRAGRRVPKWLGRDVVSAAIASLEPDCALALSTAVECALLSQNPHLSQTHCARDGLVQKYELLAMPLANRWGPPFVAIFVREYGIRYSLVDAIFRSTEHGVVALAAIRDGAGSPIDFQVVDLNDGAAKLLQKDIGELRWRRLAEGNHAFNTPNFLTSLKKLLQGSEVANFELRLPRGDGDLCLSVSLTAMGDLVCAVLTDVTELNRREQSSRLLFENNPMPMWIFDSETRYFLSVNDAAVREYGYSREQFLAMRIDQIRPGDDVATLIEAITGASEPIQSGNNWRHLKSDGSVIDVLIYSRQIQFQGLAARLVAVVDISERKKAEARATYLAEHDALTDLSNRMFYREMLSKKLVEAPKTQKQGVLCIDLDLFKNVNDSFGHPIGDRLLKLVATRLKRNLKSEDVIARLGGDEFAVILSSISEAQQAGEVAERLIQALKEPYSIDGFEIVIGASIGIALAPHDGEDADELLKNADMALYRAKTEGRGSYHFFDRSMDELAQKRRAMESDLRAALVSGELEVYYQPLVRLDTNRITSFESLLRWKQDGHFIPPSDFIPLAEATGLITQIGEWVLRTACAEAATWPDDIGVAINLSPIQFRDKNLASVVMSALAESGLNPSRLEIEITESVLLAETDANLAILHQLKLLGISISMDDFGTGYSSLSYLRSFPFDKIKIDRSFIKDIESRPDCVAIIGAISALGERLGIRTTAEGVETAAQLDCVRKEGCTEVQGYLFSAARPAHELSSMIEKIHAFDGRLPHRAA
jgi:diguanylate cyclase (GGDEF)-like protein/PAS domain S-box-containing protein